jgi:hypothetical protein
MAISVTPSVGITRQTIQGALLSRVLLTVTGLTASLANTIPHGLPRTPQVVTIVPTSAGGFHQTSTADGTNLYITADGSGTTCNFIVEY